MAEPSSLKEFACEAVSALCFNTLVGLPSALPQYFEDEALKTMLIPVRYINYSPSSLINVAYSEFLSCFQGDLLREIK